MSNINEERPNILFLMVDQLSAKWLEAASSGVCPTPNIDELRKRGATFKQAYTSNPVCCPARATIATGLTSRGHGVLQNGYELDLETPTFMNILKENGWKTGAFGKVHFHSHYNSVYSDYHSYGFDVTHITEDLRAGEWLDWVQEKYPQYYEAALATVLTTEHKKCAPDLLCYGPEKKDISMEIRELRKRFKWGTDKHPDNSMWLHTLPFPEEISQSAWITRHAIDFIKEVPNDVPFYAHVSYVGPHSPQCPPEEFMDVINDKKIPKPIESEWVDDPSAPKCFNSAKKEIPENWADQRKYYFADIAYLDSQIGNIINGLKEAGRYENTYIILLSDHGELLMDHGFIDKAEKHYDSCIRIPLIISGPGLNEGIICNSIVQLEDIFPTVLEMAGLDQPKPPIIGVTASEREFESQMQLTYGTSLVQICKGEIPKTWRTSAYIESYNNIESCTPLNWARTIRTDNFRYTMYPLNGGEQLFDMINDPNEKINLVNDAAYVETRQQLRDLLLEKIILQDYPHPPQNLFAIGVH